MLSDLGDAIYLELACRLNLDESAECKKMAADCLTLLISRVKGTKEEKKLFDTTMIWMNENKVSIIYIENKVFLACFSRMFLKLAFGEATRYSVAGFVCVNAERRFRDEVKPNFAACRESAS